MKQYSILEIATEVAWQVGDVLENVPRAESRWHVCNIAERIIKDNVINESTEDIDEVISAWLIKNKED
jgi:hypothetical protein